MLQNEEPIEAMKKQQIVFLVFIALLVIWIFRMVSEYDVHAEQVDNPAYAQYVTDYQNSVSSKIANLKEDLKNELNLDFDAAFTANSPATCRNSNFEGADVKVHGIRFFNEIYERKSAGGYSYDCNNASLDPDHPSFGLPDISIAVSPVDFFQPEDAALADFFQWMGNKKDKIGPYQTYEKQIFITNDSTGEVTARKFEMELWLTKFSVTITVQAIKRKPMVEITDSELNRKLYPKYWYGSTETSKVSVNDLIKREENQGNVYGDIQFVLEVNPNASPWYVNEEHAQTSKPKIAVAGIYCQHFKKKSLRKNKVDFNTFAGKANSLYYFPFEKDSQELDENLTSNTNNFVQRIDEINESNIWDRPYYLRLNSKNIGSRRSGALNLQQQGDQINMEFLMPLFVVGSLDVIMPSELLPEWQPPEPYSKRFTLRNLLPSWGLSGFGKVISIVILIVIGVLALNTFFPFLRFLM